MNMCDFINSLVKKNECHTQYITWFNEIKTNASDGNFVVFYWSNKGNNKSLNDKFGTTIGPVLLYKIFEKTTLKEIK
jgi:chromosomal replication initiation ATPase DnaA